MRPFIDLRGASGTAYRFRLWPAGGHHAPIAGNYAFVEPQSDGGFKVQLIGECTDLSALRGAWPKGLSRATTHLYTRLNVSRAVRASEHEDLAAYHTTAKVSRDAA